MRPSVLTNFPGPSDMARLIIYVPASGASEYLVVVRTQIRDGSTSGYVNDDIHWAVEYDLDELGSGLQ
ncbi:hypothetical protein [Mycolicibacterium nivoides]|uniref:Uncharacterized protein n=2 Tax=Mycolicibacterium nivoides TaxID=2487344 RepID=A0ABW9LIQ5_9MYCO